MQFNAEFVRGWSIDAFRQNPSLTLWLGFAARTEDSRTTRSGRGLARYSEVEPSRFSPFPLGVPQ